MNSLFKENYDIDNTEITFENNEFVTDEYDIIRGDLFLKISQEEKPYHYHIELQTRNDSTMIIRMFEYGFKKAKELSRYDNNNETVIYIPKQLVIFIEQNKNIKDELKMRLVFPDGQEVNYVVPVMKYWEYDDKKIIEEKMYPLLPLQVFKLRYKMESIRRKKDNQESQLKQTVLEAKEVAEIIAREAKVWYRYYPGGVKYSSSKLSRRLPRKGARPHTNGVERVSNYNSLLIKRILRYSFFDYKLKSMSILKKLGTVHEYY